MNQSRSDSFPFGVAAGLLAVASVDVASSRVTTPVLYTIPILLYALSHRRRWLPFLAVSAVILTFVALAIKVKFFPLTGGSKILQWRLLNRSFASVSVCLSAGLLYYWVDFYATMQRLATAQRLVKSGDSSVFRELLHSITVLFAAVAGGVLTAVILIADLLSPPAANLPILYAVPLILVSLWLQSRRVLWAMLPFFLTFTVLGYAWGPIGNDLSVYTLRSIILNRALAAVALTMVSLILHLRMHGPRMETEPATFPCSG